MLHILIETLYYVLNPLKIKVVPSYFSFIKLEVRSIFFRSICESITIHQPLMGSGDKFL
jgi:hypothetical protein